MYRAKNGKMFSSVVQGRKFDRYLDEQRAQTHADRGRQDAENAPGGEQHLHDVRQHGIVREAHIVNEGAGRWRLTSKHADGTETTSVHPQVWRAHEIAGRYLNPEGPPPALETNQRSRNAAVGEKESARIAREDGRNEDGVSTWDSFEDRD